MQVEIIHLTTQYLIVGIKTTEKYNYVREKERIFYLSNNFFPILGRD